MLTKRTAGLIAIVLLGASAPTGPLLREQTWTAPTPVMAHALTHAPQECLAHTSPGIEIGRALFRSPALLGGPAARAGLSCHACHTNGRRNANIFLLELTNRSGAADVTSEWASHVRGDGVLNPVDIPDLVGVGERTAFGDARDPSLEHFVEGVIVEEFQGVKPPDAALAGVIAYLRALNADACATGQTPITLDGAANDVRRALDAASDADAPTRSLVILAAQDGMGRIVERLPARFFARDRTRLEHLARELGALRRGETTAALATILPGWRVRFDAIIARVERRERQTYFNEATLARALAH